MRKAIETANAEPDGGPITIGFDAAAFPAASPATIEIGDNPLPAISRAGATVDASGAGVRLLSTSQSLSASNDGLVIAADDVTLRGMSIDDFSGAAVRVEGARAVLGGDAGAGQGIRVGGSGTGFALAGSDATVAGNVIGFAADGSAATVGIGIEISVGNATIGDDGQGAGFMNVVGNSDTAIRVGTGSEAAFGGTRIVRNVIGRGPDNSPAPVTTGIVIAQPSTGTLVQSNTIAYAATGISVAADVDGVSVTGNRFQQNTFQALSGMAIDLNADHTVNPNDEGDADTGANGLINSPTFTRAIQSTLTGSAGPTCGGCTVQIYLAQHVPGGATDYGTVPVAGGTVVADATGHFTLDTPAVTAGQWITGLVTDAVGNTSEFGASTRVGAGVAQCGNVTLVPGWNHVGFFGAEPANLGSIFPESGESPGAVTAIYHLRDGSTDFDHWFASDSSDRTLNVLEPGEAYWFFAERAVTLTAGFSLSVPLPVTLKPGWNDIVYIGASADVRDALHSVAGHYNGLFQWHAGAWAVYGNTDTPTWAREFTTLETCSTYELFVTSPGVLTPLQP